MPRHHRSGSQRGVSVELGGQCLCGHVGRAEVGAKQCIGKVVAQLIVISFGTTMLFSVAPTIIAQASPPERISEISGLITVIRQLFMGIGAQMVTTLLASDIVRRGDEIYPSPFAYDITVAVIAALCTVAVLTALALPRQHPSGNDA